MACADALKRTNCAVLQNHGVVTIGKTMQEAFDRFVCLEYLAQIIINATSLGPPVPLKQTVLHQPCRILEPVELCPCIQCCCTRRVISGREKEIRDELCTFVKRAYNQNLFTSSSGSISIRVRDGTSDDRMVSFVISPTNIDRQSLTAKDVCYLSNTTNCASKDCHVGCHGRKGVAASRRASSYFNLNQTRGIEHAMGDFSGKRSSSCSGLLLRGKGSNSQNTKNASWGKSIENEYEFAPISYFHKSNNAPNTRPSHAAEIHHSIYAQHPEINCVIIAQPPYTTSFCISCKPFKSNSLPESHLILGDVPSLPFESLHDKGIAIAQALDPSSHHTSSVLVNNFGVVSVGESAIKAYVQVEVCESSCGVLLTAMRRGDPLLLNNAQVNEIDEMFHDTH